MDFDLPLGFFVEDPGAVAAQAEADGFDGIWSTEAGHDPFLPLAPAAAATSRIALGTAIAVAFPRSPMVHAQAAWDLQRMSHGRFILGLGAQVRAHNERRYGVPGDRPVARMRDLIRAIRAIWSCWQDGGKLDYRGEFYSLSLMTPFFNPGALEWGPPPIYLAAVTEAMLRVAGAEAEGVHAHPLHTERFLDEVVLPVVREAATGAGRDPGAFGVAVSAMIATGRTQAEVEAARPAMRAQIAFYGSTPSYREVLEREGRGEVADQLHALSRKGAWGEMPELVDDELFEAVCTEAPWDGLAAALAKRYGSRITRLMPYAVSDDGTPWAEIRRELVSGLPASA
jgi:probable F420-dependent oxidoreductase